MRLTRRPLHPPPPTPPRTDRARARAPSFLVKIFRKALNGTGAPQVYAVPEALDANLFDPETAVQLLPRERFMFLSVFAWNYRKGYDVLLRAYFEEFTADDDVLLVLRTYPKDKEQQMLSPAEQEALLWREITLLAESWFPGKALDQLPKIEIVVRQLSDKELAGLYKSAQAFVLPSRGEGWGRPIAEAMAMELPTIATGWSGQTHFMTKRNSLMLEYDLVKVDKQPSGSAGLYLGHKWAEPRVPSLKTAMRKVFRARGTDTYTKLQKRARADVLKYTREKVGKIIVDRFLKISKKHSGMHLSVQAFSVLDTFEGLLGRGPTKAELEALDARNRQRNRQWSTMLDLRWVHKYVCRELWHQIEEGQYAAKCAGYSPGGAVAVRDSLPTCEAGVDAVYTYVNGSIAEYGHSRKDRLAKLLVSQSSKPASAILDVKSALSVSRARDFNELRYSLRSLRDNAPWIRKVFIVTDEPPAWLDTASRGIVVVPTSAIVPEADYPSFNSHSIEANIFRVPGLSDCYLYMCDDYFFTNKVGLSDWYDASTGTQRFFLDTDRTSAPAEPRSKRAVSSHDQAFKNANMLLDDYLPGGWPGKRNFVSHAPHFFLKPIVSELWDTFGDALQTTSSNPFRAWTDVHLAFLYTHFVLEQPQRFRARPHVTLENSAGGLLREPQLPTATVYLRDGANRVFESELNALISLPKDKRPLVTSINDAVSDAGSLHASTLMGAVLEELFPTVSSFERGPMPPPVFPGCAARAPESCSRTPAADAGLQEAYPLCDSKMAWMRENFDLLTNRMEAAIEGHSCDFQSFLAKEADYCPYVGALLGREPLPLGREGAGTTAAAGTTPFLGRLPPGHVEAWCPLEIHAPWTPGTKKLCSAASVTQCYQYGSGGRSHVCTCCPPYWRCDELP